jgi:3',5'-cyclic AMP phosphodiesterase CpdA
LKYVTNKFVVTYNGWSVKLIQVRNDVSLKNSPMKKFKFLFLMISVFLIVSCTKDEMPDPSGQMSEDTYDLKCASMKLKIAVVSDIHFMDPSLLPQDPASNTFFQDYLAKDPKLIEFSNPIFRKVVSDLINEKPKLVLIPGDLTKDGELVNHLIMRNLLQRLRDRGIKVLVIPGNHDINNPEALSFRGETPFPVASVTPERFADIYRDFGYKNALYRDENSLSYVSHPFDKLWILAIDACKYTNNVGTSDVSGAIKPATMEWIKGIMEKAREKNITVLAMMHHGIMEHYYGQNSLDPGYVVDNWQENAVALRDAGVKVIFTGHYHANDITGFTYEGKTLTDVETGSLVTPLSPYRIVTLERGQLQISTRRVTSINAALPGGLDFVTYSNLFLTAHLDGYFTYVLVYKFGISPEIAGVAAPFLRNASMAHFAGDENISPEEQYKIEQLANAGAPPFLIDALHSFWTDLSPEDGSIQIPLN